MQEGKLHYCDNGGKQEPGVIGTKLIGTKLIGTNRGRRKINLTKQAIDGKITRR